MRSVFLEGKEVIPSKIVCIGRNYVEHIKELNNEIPEEPVIFIKPNSSISNRLILPEKPCRYEGEISFLIKDGDISAISFGLDLTLEEIQNNLKKKGLPWEKAKAFDSSAVFSSFVPLTGPFEDLKIELHINKQLRQNGSVELMIYKPMILLKEIKKYFTLEDYDIIMTGTPSGVGAMKKGDEFTGKIYNGNELLIEKTWVAE